MKNKLNLLFLFKKRRAILKRLKEIPYNLQWYFVYSLIRKGFLYHKDYERLNDLKNVHQGKIGFLMGNGPSVKIEDLEQIANTESIITFAANRIHLIYDNTSYRPDYIISSDQQVIDDFGQEMVNNNPSHSIFFASHLKPNQLKGEYTWLKLKNGRPFKFSEEIQKKVMSGGGSLNVALQIGYHMGIREFYLYGVDHSFKFDKIKSKNGNDAKGEGNHFIKGYRSGKTWQAPRVDLIEETFKKMDLKLRENGGYLINATNGGKLEVLEREGLNQVLENLRA